MLPFLVTAIVLVITSVRMSREKVQPKGCGITTDREDAVTSFPKKRDRRSDETAPVIFCVSKYRFASAVTRRTKSLLAAVWPSRSRS